MGQLVVKNHQLATGCGNPCSGCTGAGQIATVVESPEPSPGYFTTTGVYNFNTITSGTFLCGWDFKKYEYPGGSNSGLDIRYYSDGSYRASIYEDYPGYLTLFGPEVVSIQCVNGELSGTFTLHGAGGWGAPTTSTASVVLS
jgi:hypothetical protein